MKPTTTFAKQWLQLPRNGFFFKLIDHGVAPDIINDISACLNEFFDLPMELKLKGARTGGLTLGYSASNLDYGHNLPWAEILQFMQLPEQIAEFSKRDYGNEQHQVLSNAMIRYMKALEKLGTTILEMRAQGLGLESDIFTRHFKDKETTTMIRTNRYTPCPLLERCLGLGSHSDPHTLMILLQDQGGGLQVRDDEGRWLGIHPIPNSFIVIPILLLLGMDKWKAKECCPQSSCKQGKECLSVAYFISPTVTLVIESPPELMDSGPNPRKYAPFTWGEFRKELLKQKSSRENST
ncbi:Iron/ascorbate family oxidoreductase [Handroanthus impetiginosus]|uniref:Iron/ascorbate family oxidoreductase n=1 Tax=Handroanthus impetiginosus TaxID=429701 RepID=A0A2G9H7P2_9LAMI|nr:Iron/ascorbate family oxidoreductase [Handroanthus impetiginosus]